MARTAGATILSGTDLYATETNPSTDLGARFLSQDGRAFRYAKAGGTALVIGDLQAAPAQLANFKDMACAAGAGVLNSTLITCTLGASSTTANQFKDGFLAVTAGTGIGQFFRILSHDVATNATACKFNVEEKVQVALDATSTVSVVKNPYDSVIIAPTTQTGMPTGGAVSAIAASSYGYLQVGGAGACLADATATSAAAMSLSQSVSTAGTVTKGVTLAPVVGFSIYTVTVSAEAQPIFWEIEA